MRSGTKATATTEEPCQPAVNAQYRQNQESKETSEKTNSVEISGSGLEMSVENDGNVNSNINMCIDTEHPEEGNLILSFYCSNTHTFLGHPADIGCSHTRCFIPLFSFKTTGLQRCGM